MSLLSLGLLKDERADVARESAAESEDSAEPEGAVSNPSNRTGSSSLRDGSLANHPADSQTAGSNGTVGSHAMPTPALSSFDPVSTQSRAGLEGRSYTSDQTGEDARPTEEAISHLHAAIEELRQKVSGSELPQAFIWG